MKIIFKLCILIGFTQSLLYGELLIVVKDATTGFFRAMTNEETLKYQNTVNDILTQVVTY
jgi:hypothetical protein